MMELLILFDSGSEVSLQTVSRSAMVLEIATVLLGVVVGALAVLYAAPKGYLGHRKTKSAAPLTRIDTYATTAEQAREVPATVAPAVAQPAPSPAPEPAHATAMYESVQPAPRPVTYSARSTSSFGAPTLTKKPTQTYRRRTAPVRSSAGSKKTLAKPKKR